MKYERFTLANSDLRYDCHEEQEDTLSLEMIRNNAFEMHWLLKMKENRENAVCSSYQYDISNLESLKKYFSENAVNRETVYGILKQILQCLQKCSFYMIPSDQIALDESLVFYDKVIKKIYLCCVPVCGEKQSGILRQFLCRVLDMIYLDVDSFCHQNLFQNLYEKIEEGEDRLSYILEQLEVLYPEKQQKEKTQPVQSEKNEKISESTVYVERNVNQPLPVQEETSFVQRILKTKNPASGNLGFMERFRQIQNSNGASTHTASSRPVPVPTRSSAVAHTMLISHEEPDQKAFLICPIGKVQIDPNGSIIGRRNAYTTERITIFFESIHVSAYHARLEYDFDKKIYTVTDFSKTTGVKKNGKVIPKNSAVRIDHNDELIFGDVACRVVLEEEKK